MAPFTNCNDEGRGGGGGGWRERFIFYTQRNHNFRICLPIKITTFLLAYLQKSLSPFFATPKNPFIFFLRPKKIQASPKKSLLAKISASIKSFDPTPPPPPPPSLNYVSGANWEELFRRMLDERTAGLLSVGFLDTDSDSLGSNVTLDERYRHPNDKGSITYCYLLREMSL